MTPDERATAAFPAAAALVCAVADGDQDEVNRILLAPDLDWMALCVVLAGHVSDDTRFGEEKPLSLHNQVQQLLHLAAEAFDTTPEAIRSHSRYRNTLDARVVTMAALRWSGHSASWIGRELGRDHSTVLSGVTRVGETPRLRSVAQRLATRVFGIVSVEGNAA
jgi:hypothetical protein